MTVEFDDEDPLAHRSRAADLERIKQARKKRQIQLRKWQEYDRNMERNKSRASGRINKSKHPNRRIHFDTSVVLLEAATREDIDEVRRILNEGGSPNVCNDDGLTALHQACIDNSLMMCQLLLQYQADVNATDSELWTPLHASAACAHIDICQCLIEHNANLLALNAEGNMPYDICEEENTLDLIENAMAMRGITQEQIDETRRIPELKMLKEVKEFEKSGGDLCMYDSQGASMLHISASCGYVDVGRFLLEKHVPITLLDKDGWQPIHVAACWGQMEFIEFLLHHGADPDCTTTSGETVYEICEDIELNRRLQQIVEEIDRRKEMKKSLELKPNLTSIGRRNNSSLRSASIRRSSMREKSLMSWKEARQEAIIRERIEQKMAPQIPKQPTDSNLTHETKPVSVGVSNDNDAMKNKKKDQDIPVDLDQVKLEALIATEEELTRKGVVPGSLIRRGSSRNSFTHKHPYHSPVRDPSLLLAGNEDSIAEEPVDQITPMPKPRTNLNVSDNRVSQSTVQPDPNFIRNCDPNASVNYKKSNHSSQPSKSVLVHSTTNSSQDDALATNQPPPSSNQLITKPRRGKGTKIETDRNDIQIHKHKAQGCCLMM